MFDSASDGSITAESVNLSPSCDTGTNLMFDHITRNLFTEFFHEEGPFRSWTYKAHVTFQNVEQLRKLIDAGPPDYFAHCCYAGVISHGPGFLFAFLRTAAHRASSRTAAPAPETSRCGSSCCRRGWRRARRDNCRRCCTRERGSPAPRAPARAGSTPRRRRRRRPGCSPWRSRPR